MLLAFLFMYVPPKYFWPAGIITLSMPIALGLNILFLFVWILKRSYKALLPAAVLFLFWGYYERGLALNLGSGSGTEQIAADADSAKIVKVLSYNVRIFNTYKHLQDKNQRSSKKMIKWVATHPADVYCLQEFYNDPDSEIYNSLSRIGRQHQKYMFLSKTLVNRTGSQFGMAIFSRYPILNKGTLSFGKLTQNHSMYADIKFPHDTIRVYNFHFQSMKFEEKEIVDTYKDKENFVNESKVLLRRFRKGFIARSDQVNIFLDHVKQSPYPVIFCGDVNDVPFSYTYQRLTSDYTNAFAEKGTGIGATYNGKVPFVRIDNQFCSKDFEVLNVTLHDSITYSDHYPISAVYKLIN